MKPLNVRWKLTVWYGGVLAAVLALFGGVVYVVMRHQFLERIDQGLEEELSDVLSEVERAKDSAGLTEWLNRRFAHHEGFDFEITDSRGRPFFVNPRMIEHSLSFAGAPAAATPRFASLQAGSPARWRVVAVRAEGPEGPLTIKVGRSLASFDHEMRELLFTFIVTGPITLLIAVSGGYFLACRALRPVSRMTQTAQRISADRLNERVAVDNPHDELGTLAETLNEMIERLEHSFTEMRRFTADAAHELRTPLAVIRSEAEVALRSSRSAEEYARVLENLLEEANRLSSMADRLLFLCRQDAGLQPPGQEVVQIDELLADLVANLQLVAQEKGVDLALDRNEPCQLLGDSRQFRRLLYNLVDNAIKYTAAPGTVSLASRKENGLLAIVVADTGIGISAEHLPRIFDRFYRVDPARSDENGAGLGLAICQSLVRAMGGTIRVESIVGRGTTFTVAFSIPRQADSFPARCRNASTL
ncbi:MAG: heavy metal sensor histidine kinase [Pirellulales bacterium]